MKYNKINLIKNGKSYEFDRNVLIEGYTNNQIFIPSGGVILKNGSLAGYILNENKKKWQIVGKVDMNDDNYSTIPQYLSQKNIQNQSAGKKTEEKISLKTAVKILREYYRNNFN